MARSNRRRSSSGVRAKKDWVYTRAGYPVDPIFLQSGSANTFALPLTISQNARREIVFGTPGVEPMWVDYYQVQSGAAMPEGSKLKVYAVEATLMVVPNDLAASTFFRLGTRLMHGVMDNASGELSIEGGYSMWEDTAATGTIAEWANAGFLREWYEQEIFSTSFAGLIARAGFRYRYTWRSQRGITLGNDRAMYLYMETDINSRALSVFPRCRALVGVNT